MRLILLLALALLTQPVFAQLFQRVTFADPAHRTSFNQPYAGVLGYHGAAWVDVNNDGFLDLFQSPKFLYVNQQNGNFLLIDTSFNQATPIQSGANSGTTWADFDNDGLIDCFVAGLPSRLYRNRGDLRFSEVTTGVFGGPNPQLPGWAAAWGDADLDGYVDLVITHPVSLLGPVPSSFLGAVAPGPSHFLLNNDGVLERNTDYGFTQGMAPYTVPTWGDYDDDGDFDLFIASGPAGAAGLDSIYRNLTNDGPGTPIFELLTGLPFTDSLQDGQVYNFIDYDNDLDLDIALTNYANAPNRLYRNDGGTYNLEPAAFSVGGNALSNAWGDFDNDGDQDVLISNEAAGLLRGYRNNGDGTFTADQSLLCNHVGARGISLGDYDNDGDLDAYVTAPGIGRSLYQNALDNGNHWLQVECVGTVSNASAIGAKLFIRTSEGWQRRDISAQNTFNGHHSLRAHFGLGAAEQIDSLIIEWPSGLREAYADIFADQLITVTEGGGITNIPAVEEVITEFRLLPNPVTDQVTVSYRLAQPATVILELLTADGRLLSDFQRRLPESADGAVTWNLSSLPAGVYFTRLTTGSGFRTVKLVLN